MKLYFFYLQRDYCLFVNTHFISINSIFISMKTYHKKFKNNKKFYQKKMLVKDESNKINDNLFKLN